MSTKFGTPLLFFGGITWRLTLLSVVCIFDCGFHEKIRVGLQLALRQAYQPVQEQWQQLCVVADNYSIIVSCVYYMCGMQLVLLKTLPPLYCSVTLTWLSTQFGLTHLTNDFQGLPFSPQRMSLLGKSWHSITRWTWSSPEALLGGR